MSPIVNSYNSCGMSFSRMCWRVCFFRYILTGKYKDTMDKAEKAAEVIKEKKLLEVKEKFLQ